MPWWRGRRPSWRERYVIVLIVCALFLSATWMMFAQRPIFEPAVEALHTLWFSRRRALPYEASYYAIYAALPGIFGLVGLAALVWSMATHRSTDAKLDAFLEPRLPTHEIRLGDQGPRDKPPDGP